MQQVFSPKQVATAIGASESSVKRWCDRGIIRSVKTAGGHRRVPIAEILDFIRTGDRGIVAPEVIGLPKDLDSGRPITDPASEFKQQLLAGNYEGCRRVLLQLFLAQTSIAKILDDVVATAMHDVGDDWCDGKLEVYEERRSCELVTRLIYDLRSTLPTVAADAPVAMGGGIESDPYTLPCRMVEMVLVDLGWNCSSLGTNVPLSSFIDAIETHKPRLFWLSISAIEDEQTFLEWYARLSNTCGSSTALVVGGRGITDELRAEMDYSAHCENLHRFEAFAKAIYQSNRHKNGAEK